MVRLHHDSAVESVAGEDGRAGGWAGNPLEERRLGRHPGIRKPANFPEVLMGVDSHFSGMKRGPIFRILTRNVAELDRGSRGVRLQSDVAVWAALRESGVLWIVQIHVENLLAVPHRDELAL
jgi:hypothetical protein